MLPGLKRSIKQEAKLSLG